LYDQYIYLGFGWLNDPLLLQVQKLIDLGNAVSNDTIGWTNAVPGPSVNYTSIADTRRRHTPDTFKTGKKNRKQVAQYVRYQNMTIMHTCISPMDSQNTSLYIEGIDFPACEHYQHEWNESTAEKKGYTLPFGSDYANRIQGTDANMFGRPVTYSKAQVFISDIYRSAYITNEGYGDVDWDGIRLRRYSIQLKDMLNSTMNPENAQYFAFGPNGVLNTSKAVNIAVFVSFPHFLYADDSLREAVIGMVPNEETHLTYVDVEPQSGLLARARKRIQVNYLMKDYSIPEVSPETVALGYAICDNITALSEAIADSNAPIDPPGIACNVSIVTDDIVCLAKPSTWKFYNGGVYMPYGWVSEDLTLPHDDAVALQNDLFIYDDYASNIRYWGLIVSGIFFACLVSMIVYNYINLKQNSSRLEWYKQMSKQNGNNNGNNDPLDFGESVNENTAQPLLTNNGNKGDSYRIN
jgi:hypothetical protein